MCFSDPVKDDAMKISRLFAVPAVAFAVSGCTVHHHYYNSSAGPETDPNAIQTIEERLALIAELEGVHAAIKATLDNISYDGANGYQPQRVTFKNEHNQPIIWIEFRHGGLIETNRDLDIAIVGNGFLEIEDPRDDTRDVAYTRNGRLALNDDRELVWGDKDGPRLTDRIARHFGSPLRSHGRGSFARLMWTEQE